MGAASFFRSRGFTSVAGRTYPGTFAVVHRDNFLAEQVANRDSASWKKAEHIAIEEVQPDEGCSIIPRWKMLTDAEPVGVSIQRLYVAIGSDRYVVYDSAGMRLGTGALADIVNVNRG